MKENKKDYVLMPHNWIKEMCSICINIYCSIIQKFVNDVLNWSKLKVKPIKWFQNVFYIYVFYTSYKNVVT